MCIRDSVWTLSATYADCKAYNDYSYQLMANEINEQKAQAIAGGFDYTGPLTPEDMVAGSDFGDWYDYHSAQVDRCKTIGVLPTSIINGGNASVVNGIVVFDPTPSS